MLVYSMQEAPTHRIHPKTPKRPIKISPQHFFWFLWTIQSCFTHHKCLVNCDCNDARTTWKQLQSTTDDREIAINMHLFAYAVIRSLWIREKECFFFVLFHFSYPHNVRISLFVFLFSFFFFHFFCFKMQAMPKNVWCPCTPNIIPHTPTYSFHLSYCCSVVTRSVRIIAMENVMLKEKNSHTHIHTHGGNSNARFTYSFSLITFNPFLLCQFSIRKRVCSVCLVLQTNVFALLCSVVHALTFFLTSFLLILVIVRFYIPF